eukprot:2319367-Prymnesium_polylepis.2
MPELSHPTNSSGSQSPAAGVHAVDLASVPDDAAATNCSANTQAPHLAGAPQVTTRAVRPGTPQSASKLAAKPPPAK